MMLDLEMSDLARRYSSEYVFFKILQISQENTCAGISFFTLFFMPSGLQLYYKETPTQMFFCEIYEIFKNSLFYRTPLAGASGDLNNQVIYTL